MDTFQGLVKRLIDVFNRLQVGYMLSGAVASSYYGLPRMTMDVGIIVAASNMGKESVVEGLREIGLVVSVEDFERALDSGCNVVSIDDSKSPFTVDFIG